MLHSPASSPASSAHPIRERRATFALADDERAAHLREQLEDERKADVQNRESDDRDARNKRKPLRVRPHAAAAATSAAEVLLAAGGLLLALDDQQATPLHTAAAAGAHNACALFASEAGCVVDAIDASRICANAEMESAACVNSSSPNVSATYFSRGVVMSTNSPFTR